MTGLFKACVSFDFRAMKDTENRIELPQSHLRRENCLNKCFSSYIPTFSQLQVYQFQDFYFDL